MKNSNLLKRTYIVCLLAMLCCFLWGSAFPCVKIGYEMFQTVLQYLFFYIGLAHTSGVKASIVEASDVFHSVTFVKA